MTGLYHRLSTLLLTTLIALSAAAQQFAVSGRLCERGDTLTPLPLCSVELLSTTDSLRLAHTTTGNDGRFTLAPTAAGRYLVRASFIGYDTVVQTVSVTQQRPSVQLADIIMEDKSHRLGEAQVTTLSRQLTIKADTFVYHAAAFQVPAGATLSVLLKQLSGLEMQSDGTLKFQGKTVSSILVGGKEFFADNETALANLPAEAVSDVKAYEKTDELKAFTGSVDTDKATVLDLKIKREWLGVWSGNFDVAGGTDERYSLRGFASTFTDHRRLAVYGSVNDISERQEVDENGNWNNRSNTNGLLTYRGAGVIYSWDNGRKEGAPGAFDIHLNASVKHNDYTYDRRANTVTLLTDRSAQYAYTHSYSRDHQVSGGANVTLKWVTDSLNYLRFYGNISKNKSRTPYQQLSSTYSAEQLRDDAYATLMTTTDTTAAVYGASDGNFTANKFIEYSTKLDWVHRFDKAGRSLNFGLNFYGNSNDKATDYLTLYRHFNASTLRTVNRQYNDANTDSQGFTFSAIYEDALTKALRLHINYNYAYSRDADGRTLWQLDRDLAYASDALPLGTRPLLVDSLLNVDNTYHGTLYDNTHALTAGIKGQWEHLEMSLTASGKLARKSLHYARGLDYYSPSQDEREVQPFVYLKWKPASTTSLSFNYSCWHEFVSLYDLLPIVDDANIMSVNEGNPELRNGYTHKAALFFTHFDAKRGNTHNVYSNFTHTDREVATALATDPVTGQQTTTKTNVNGNYTFNIAFFNMLSLDTARHWSLIIMPQGTIRRSQQYVGTIGDDRGLSVMNSYLAGLDAGINYRNGIVNFSAKVEWKTQFTRYESAPTMNETGHQYGFLVNPQLNFPNGFKVGTSFQLWGRTGYKESTLNHPQWLWNLSVEQAFLKSKALVLRLEGVDILHERTAEYATATATGRSYSSVKCFPAYWMLHVIYRFNTKRS